MYSKTETLGLRRVLREGDVLLFELIEGIDEHAALKIRVAFFAEEFKLLSPGLRAPTVRRIFPALLLFGIGSGDFDGRVIREKSVIRVFGRQIRLRILPEGIPGPLFLRTGRNGLIVSKQPKHGTSLRRSFLRNGNG